MVNPCLENIKNWKLQPRLNNHQSQNKIFQLLNNVTSWTTDIWCKILLRIILSTLLPKYHSKHSHEKKYLEKLTSHSGSPIPQTTLLVQSQLSNSQDLIRLRNKKRIVSIVVIWKILSRVSKEKSRDYR